MRYDICIVTTDKYYSQWIRLELSSVGNSVCFSETLSSAPSANLYIVDADSASLIHKAGAKIILFGHERKKDKEKNIFLERPFSKKELFDACEKAKNEASAKKEKAPDFSGKGQKAIIYNGREISLTEKEFALYSLLCEAKGESVEREILSQKLWGGADDNSLNLYVHYLRKKLECDGKKAIRSHRNKGYSLILQKEEG